MIVQRNVSDALLSVGQPIGYDDFPKGASPLRPIYIQY
jgi:hypothetical protein